MNQGNSTTNVVLVLILVAVVGFGVWYFAYRTPAEDNSGAGINIELDGGSEEGGNGGAN